MTNSNNPFPNYLGYGLQEKSSYQFNPDTGVHKCRYHFIGMTIMEAEISKENATFQEIYDGVLIGAATDVTLEKAVYKYYAGLDSFATNPIYSAWAKQVVDIGNVYLNFFRKSNFHFLYFPAVYFTTIQIPLKPEKEIIAEKILADKEYGFLQPWVQQGMMETEFYENTVKEKISFLSLISAVAYVPYILKKLINLGVIDTEKRYRAVVGATVFYHSSISQQFQGDRNDNWKSYTLEYQHLNPSLKE